jgi:citrate synthase
MAHLTAKKKIGNLTDPRLPYDYMNREYGTVPQDTSRMPFQWVSEVAYKNVHRIVARGYDTTELMEQGYGIVDMLFVDFQARIPTLEEEQMMNYIMILSLEDGVSMPAVMSRMTARSKTFLTQAAAASILAFGHAYGAYSAFGNRLAQYLARAEKEGLTLAEAARLLVAEHGKDESLGVSDLMLEDPAARRVFARAEKLGVAGPHVAFMKEVVSAAQEVSDEPVDLDLLGATGAAAMDL